MRISASTYMPIRRTNPQLCFPVHFHISDPGQNLVPGLLVVRFFFLIWQIDVKNIAHTKIEADLKLDEMSKKTSKHCLDLTTFMARLQLLLLMCTSKHHIRHEEWRFYMFRNYNMRAEGRNLFGAEKLNIHSIHLKVYTDIYQFHNWTVHELLPFLNMTQYQTKFRKSPIVQYG